VRWAANSKAKVYLSVSDLYDADPVGTTAEIGLSEFIPALIAEASIHGKFPWGICVDTVYRLTKTVGAEHVSVSSCAALTSLLIANFADQTPLLFIDSTYSFPKVSLADEVASFAYGYYSALFNDRIDAYIASVGSDTDKIAEIIAMIDTKDHETVSGMALFTLKADNWKKLIPNWDKDELVIRSLSTYDAETEPPSGIKGQYRYYTFDTFLGTTDLKAGYYCSDIRITDDGGPMLAATLAADAYGRDGSCKWMGITHMFDYPENLKITPVLQVTLKVDEVLPSVKNVPVKLVLLGEEERFESAAEIPVGQWTTLYIYTGSFNEAYDTEGLQLLVGGSSFRSAVLSVREINGLSREYNNESLESVIAEERLKKRSETEDDGYGAYLWIGGAVITAVATVIVVILLSKRTPAKKKEDNYYDKT